MVEQVINQPGGRGMRPFPEKTGSPSVPVSQAPVAPKGLERARAVVFPDGLAGEVE
jgi:hypothetical protein